MGISPTGRSPWHQGRIGSSGDGDTIPPSVYMVSAPERLADGSLGVSEVGVLSRAVLIVLGLESETANGLRSTVQPSTISLVELSTKHLPVVTSPHQRKSVAGK